MPRTGRRTFLLGVGASALGLAGLGWRPAGGQTARAGRGRLLTGPLPAGPVAIGSCAGYERGELGRALAGLFELLGGLEPLVAGRTVTVKVNLTGSPDRDRLELPVGETYQTHPATVLALVDLLGRAGARRVRVVESLADGLKPDDLARRAGWDWTALEAAGPAVSFVDTRGPDASGRYVRLAVPDGGFVYPAFDVHPAYERTDVYLSLAKLKLHSNAGVTLAVKNSFGITPSSLYGDDAGQEDASAARRWILHYGTQAPPLGVPAELDPSSPREPGWRVPRIIADLLAARPIDLAIVDGIATVAGGEGPWVQNLRPIRPGLLVAGLNAVATDAIATAVLGYDPRVGAGRPPFPFDNHLALAAEAGLGSNDPEQIELRGLPLQRARERYAAALALVPPVGPPAEPTWRPKG